MSIVTSIRNFFYEKSYSKVIDTDIVANAPLTDHDVERIDITYAKTVREAVRWLAVNNTDVNSIIIADKAGIIGSNVNIQSRIIGEPELNAEIEDYIQEFSEFGNCEVTGRWYLDELWRSMVEFTKKDGGFILRHHYNTSWAIPYRVEMIEIGMIDIDGGREDDTVLNGLKKDRYGKVTGIYLYTNQERNKSKLTQMKDLTFYSPVWVSISQYTALSKLASVLPTIDKLDQYGDAELKSAVENAKAGLYWQTSMYDDIMKIVKNIKDVELQKSSLTTLMTKISEQGVKPNGLTPIPLGDDVVVGTRTGQTIFKDLSQNSQLKVASSQGMSSSIVYQDPSQATYSAIKSALAFTQINWSIEFDNLKEKVMKPIMNRVIETGVTSGRLTLPDYFKNPRKYHKLTYMRVSEIDIEPTKTAQANTANLENGTHSAREITAKRGRNLEDVQRENIQDEIAYIKMRTEMFKEAGVDIPLTPDEMKMDNDTNTDEGEDDE